MVVRVRVGHGMWSRSRWRLWAGRNRDRGSRPTRAIRGRARRFRTVAKVVDGRTLRPAWRCTTVPMCARGATESSASAGPVPTLAAMDSHRRWPVLRAPAERWCPYASGTTGETRTATASALTWPSTGRGTARGIRRSTEATSSATPRTTRPRCSSVAWHLEQTSPFASATMPSSRRVVGSTRMAASRVPRRRPLCGHPGTAHERTTRVTRWGAMASWASRLDLQERISAGAPQPSAANDATNPRIASVVSSACSPSGSKEARSSSTPGVSSASRSMCGWSSPSTRRRMTR